MTIADAIEEARSRLGSSCPEPIEAAVLVHRGPETGGGGLRKMFGGKTVASRLAINNYLVLTPTHLRLITLGGRSGVKPKDEIGAWPRGSIRIDARTEERHTHYVSYGTSTDQRVFRLHLTGADLDLTVDVMSHGGLDVADIEALEHLDEETDPEVREGMAGLQEIGDDTAAMVNLLVTATGGTSTAT